MGWRSSTWRVGHSAGPLKIRPATLQKVPIGCLIHTLLRRVLRRFGNGFSRVLRRGLAMAFTVPEGFSDLFKPFERLGSGKIIPPNPPRSLWKLLESHKDSFSDPFRDSCRFRGSYTDSYIVYRNFCRTRGPLKHRESCRNRCLEHPLSDTLGAPSSIGIRQNGACKGGLRKLDIGRRSFKGQHD